MKKLLLILLLSSPCLASGPKYNYEDPHLNDEMENVYKDIGNVLKGNVRISSVTISTLTVISCTGCGSVSTSLTISTLTVTSSTTLKGTQTNDDAAQGNIGEVIQSVVSGTNFTTSGNFGTITSILLTPGDWDVGGSMLGDRGTATQLQFTIYQMQIVTNPAGVGVDGYTRAYYNEGATGISSVNLAIPPFRLSLASNTTAYLQGAATYSGGQPLAYGGLIGRRAR